MVRPVAQRTSRHRSTVFIITQGQYSVRLGITHKEVKMEGEMDPPKETKRTVLSYLER